MVELSGFNIHTRTDTDVNKGQESRNFIITWYGPGIVFPSVPIHFLFFFFSFFFFLIIREVCGLTLTGRGSEVSKKLKVLRQDKDGEQK